MHKILSAALILLVTALLLAGCSADDLQKVSNSIGRLDGAGLGNAGNEVVNEASDTINSFIVNYERCFSWYDPVFETDEGTGNTRP